MKITASRGGRLALLSVSITLIGIGVAFFALQDLSTADQYASVASFFVGLFGLAISLWSFAAMRASPASGPISREAEAAQTSERSSAAEQGITMHIVNQNNDSVQIGHHLKTTVYKTVHLPASTWQAEKPILEDQRLTPDNAKGCTHD